MMADSSWTLSRIWAALKKMWLVIGLTTVLGAGIAFGIGDQLGLELAPRAAAGGRRREGSPDDQHELGLR